MVRIELSNEQAEFVGQVMGQITVNASAPNAALVVATVAAVRQQIGAQQAAGKVPPKKQEKQK